MCPMLGSLKIDKDPLRLLKFGSVLKYPCIEALIAVCFVAMVRVF